jgi:4a-hydroxytetrahydrobiopterin dehydratase
VSSQPSGWDNQDGARLVKTFRFPDFVQALAFVNRIGRIAEAEGHHPDLLLSWGKVRVELTTHDAGGVTEKDFSLAAKIDAEAPGSAPEASPTN